MASVNRATKTKKAATEQGVLRTHEGAVAAFATPIEQLRRSVMANMLWEGQFYEDGQSIAQRIQDLTAQILKQENGADTVANIAFEARSKMKLRHVPLLLLVSLIKAQTEQAREVVAGAIANVVQRPDEISELVALYWLEKKQPLTAQMKKGLALAFNKFDNEHTLAKWNGGGKAIRLADVLALCHVKPKNKDQGYLFAKLANKSFFPVKTRGGVYDRKHNEVPTGYPVARVYGEFQKLATPDTWETALSAGSAKAETFERLIREGNLGALALLRNLRNMQESGVDNDLIRKGLSTMKIERVLPFRFITAARYAPKLEPELEQAMFKCLEGHEKLAGKTVLVVDNSGSMADKLSGKSELRRVDAACALAMLLREVCEEVQIVVFGSTAGLVRPRRGFALRDEIVRSEHNGGTDTAKALAVAAKEGYDRIIVITDEQSHTSIGGPIAGTKGYFINVASNANGIGYGLWTHLNGFSENILPYIVAKEVLEQE